MVTACVAFVYLKKHCLGVVAEKSVFQDIWEQFNFDNNYQDIHHLDRKVTELMKTHEKLKEFKGQLLKKRGVMKTQIDKLTQSNSRLKKRTNGLPRS